MEFRSQDDRFEVNLRQEAFTKMSECAESDPEREVGGVLLGHYSPDLRTAFVEAVTDAPAGSVGSRVSFHRTAGQLPSLLRGLWAREPRQYYLGEWHYHPSTSTAPSGPDTKQMQGIAANAKYQCPEPVLVILGKQRAAGTEPNASVTVFTAREVFRLERDVDATASGSSETDA